MVSHKSKTDIRSDNRNTARPETHQNLIHPDKEHTIFPIGNTPLENTNGTEAKPF